ncbi:histone-lysine N-methyltransferase ASHH3-like isoform X3 [Tasmannia lanceolata]|uniref:histone-lysine N-methyltransferase ASHH3-like isoform X3 n=1 Tax=Tasmannia lanceolata TaxID=3420 RepID=UPI0040628B54
MGDCFEAIPAMNRIPELNSAGDVLLKMLHDFELPCPPTHVEFQLPDWVKKGKPMSYTFIKHNVYLTKKVKRSIGDDGIFCSCGPSPGSSSVCDRDCLCGMLLSSCSTSCKCGDSCLNKPFQHRIVKKMKLVKTEKCGLGLVADEDIKQGEFVIEYVGEVIDDITCEERLWKMKHRGETNFYLCEINRDMVIDATYKGNKSRFINHSCQPNTQMQKWRIDGETRIGIFAIRNIRRGEDVTYDYQFVQFGADQNCHCGALGCRQKLGTKPGKPNLSSPDATLKLVACEVAASSPAVKALLFRKDSEGFPTGVLDRGSSHFGSPYRRELCFQNCIGEFVKVRCPREERTVKGYYTSQKALTNQLRRKRQDEWYAGYISHFNRSSRKHTIIFMDRSKAIIDLSKATWEFL